MEVRKRKCSKIGGHNCSVTVQSKMKPMLLAPVALVEQLGFQERDRFLTTWAKDFRSATLRPDIEGRIWKRARGSGRARLRIKDTIRPAPRFAPVRNLEARIRRDKKGNLRLVLSQPLRKASTRRKQPVAMTMLVQPVENGSTPVT